MGWGAERHNEHTLLLCLLAVDIGMQGHVFSVELVGNGNVRLQRAKPRSQRCAAQLAGSVYCQRACVRACLLAFCQSHVCTYIIIMCFLSVRGRAR